MKQNYPILEFDNDTSAIIEPSKLIQKNEKMPERCVLCFFNNIIKKMQDNKKITEITFLESETGKHPVYLINETTPSVALIHPCVGAPIAAGLLEELIALGSKKFIACGGCGTLDSCHEVGKVIVPISAVRDEGTSYHYLPPSYEVEPNKHALEVIKTTLTNASILFELCKTWTTDAFYRETRAKINLRKENGCKCVEMEASALFAVGQFRNVEIAQILYAGDDLSGEFWDSRSWSSHDDIREGLLEIAISICKNL